MSNNCHNLPKKFLSFFIVWTMVLQLKYLFNRCQESIITMWHGSLNWNEILIAPFLKILKLSRFHHHFLKPTRLQWKPISGFQIQTFSCLSYHTLINPNPFLNCKTSNLMPLCNFKEHASPKGFNVYHKFFR